MRAVTRNHDILTPQDRAAAARVEAPGHSAAAAEAAALQARLRDLQRRTEHGVEVIAKGRAMSPSADLNTIGTYLGFGIPPSDLIHPIRGIHHYLQGVHKASKRPPSTNAKDLLPLVAGLATGGVRGAHEPPLSHESKQVLHSEVAKALRGVNRKVFREHNISPKEIANGIVAGAPGRHWYEHSAHAILQMAGGDKELADRFAQLVAIYSPQRAPIPNMQLAVNAFNEWKQTGRVESFGTADQIRKANDILAGKPWAGRKTDRFYANMLESIDPAKYRKTFKGGEVTNDIWMARLFGLKTDTPTPREYAAMEDAIQRVAKRLGWKPKQVQAALWIAKKAQTEGTTIGEAGVNFADALRHESGVVPFEAAPGAVTTPELYDPYSKLAPEAQRAYTTEKAQAVGDFLREAGVLGRLGNEGVGVYEGQINPGWSAYVAASRGKGPENALLVSKHGRATLDSTTAAIGEALNQDSAAWFKPFYRKNIPASKRNGMYLSVGRTITADEARTLDSAFRAAGHDIAIVHSADGAYMLNFSDLSNRDFQNFVGQTVNDSLPAAGGSLTAFAFDGNYIPRSDYANHIRPERGAATGSPDLLAGALVRLQDRSAAIDGRYLSGSTAGGPGGVLGALDAAAHKLAGGDTLNAGIPLSVDTGAERGLLQRGEYQPRTMTLNDLEQQLPKSRSRLTHNVVVKPLDRASALLQKSRLVTNTKGVRLVTLGERVAKAAGRERRVEPGRHAAQFHEELNALTKVKQGSPEDVANFWYAQLPASHRNAEGLGLIVKMQEEELQRITSGAALESLQKREAAVKAELSQAETGGEAGRALRELEDIKKAMTDLPQRASDVAASIGHLRDIAANAPAVDEHVMAAINKLMADRERIFAESGRLQSDRAAQRETLLARELGLDPTGQEMFVGHRLPKPDATGASYVSSGGTGRVKSPQGIGSTNNLVLARTGRLTPSVRVVVDDWRAAQAFEGANHDRGVLAAAGAHYDGHVPADHVLINPKGRTVPAHWKDQEFQQLSASYNDIEKIRGLADDIVSGFIADNPHAFEMMKEQALADGVQWNELRVVPKRFVERYYAQFKPSGARGRWAPYDGAVDAVSTSIVFARVGYIPKNLVQNLIMSVPHQGPLLLVNATRAAQVLADKELRYELQAEVGHTGATGALGSEAGPLLHRAFEATANFVGKIADDPVRMSAFLHEAAAEGVISKVSPLLTQKDRAALLELARNPAKRPLLNDIRQRSVEAMADFSRLTPDQSRIARRILIIPGWLMAGTRYPFHFAINHPVRSALLAYIAMGEPGAPDSLQFNKPIDQYFTHGLPTYLSGIKVGDKVLRTGSLSPVNTPEDIGTALYHTAKGISQHDYTDQTAFDYANPFGEAVVNIAQGQGVTKSLERLAPNYSLVHGIAHPGASKSYPDDKTLLGRIEREIGVVPIHVNSPAKQQAASAMDKAHAWETKAKKDLGSIPPEIARAKETQALYHEAMLAKKHELGVKSLSDSQRLDVKLTILSNAHPQYSQAAETFRTELAQQKDPRVISAMDRWVERALLWNLVSKYSSEMSKLEAARG